MLVTVIVSASLIGHFGFAAEDLTDLGTVPLFDGNRAELLSAWGGPWCVGNARAIGLRALGDDPTSRVLCVDLGAAKAGETRFFQCLASGCGPSKRYQQTRDLSRYEKMTFLVRNATGAALRCEVELKDYRDSIEHRATFRYDLPANDAWIPVEVPLHLDAADWTAEGDPDLGRILSIDFRATASVALSRGGIFLDDLMLKERLGPLRVDEAPLAALVQRLARRQWEGLWASRSREHGLIPNNSYQVTDAGLNTTATMLWMIPAAVRRQWIARSEADDYVALLLRTIDTLLARSKHLPPRNVDWVTLKPSLLPEESSVDAAFLALALHQYKSMPATPPELRRAIDETENRFDFASFGCAEGWRMAYRYASPHHAEGMIDCIYDGYTNEGNLISLAAHLNRRHHVPIEAHWNSAANRVRASLAGDCDAPIVHTIREFRAPFAQALWNLFADVRDRGVDCFPDDRLAVNPWRNFVCYEQQVMRRLSSSGRRYMLQPDAGDDGSLECYRQFSMYEDFGQRDLFMPWSAPLALLAGADGAEDALRYLLRHRLHDPFGLADSARWVTGAAEPHAITARHDFWNTALATMALLEWLDGPQRQSKSFAELPEVREALDRVFRTPAAEARARAG